MGGDLDLDLPVLSIEWNSKRLGEPARGIATINCTQNLPGSVSSVGHLGVILGPGVKAGLMSELRRNHKKNCERLLLKITCQIYL